MSNFFPTVHFNFPPRRIEIIHAEAVTLRSGQLEHLKLLFKRSRPLCLVVECSAQHVLLPLCNRQCVLHLCESKKLSMTFANKIAKSINMADTAVNLHLFTQLHLFLQPPMICLMISDSHHTGC